VSSFEYFICLTNAVISVMFYIAEWKCVHVAHVTLTQRHLLSIFHVTQRYRLTVRPLLSIFPTIQRYRTLSSTKRNSWVKQRFLVCQHMRRQWCINPLMNPLESHRRIVTQYFIRPCNIFNMVIVEYVFAAERIYYCLLFV